MKNVPAQVVVLDKEYLPTPPKTFWESLRMVRNYHLLTFPVSTFSDLPLGIGGEFTLRSAFDEVDYYLEHYRLIEEDSVISE